MSRPEAGKQTASNPPAPPTQDARNKTGDDKTGADASEAAETAPSQARPEPGRRSRAGAVFSHLLASIFGGLVAVGAAYVGVEQFREKLPILTDMGATTLRNRIAALERRMDTFEFDGKATGAETKSSQAAPATAAVPASDPRLQEKVAAANSLAEQTWSQLRGVEQRVASLEGRAGKGDPALPPSVLDDRKLRAELNPLKERLDALDKTIQGMSKWRQKQQHSQRTAAASSALNDLRRAFEQGRPYEAELRIVMESAPVTLDLSGLAGRQSTGVESQGRLLERFNKASKEALNAVSRSKGGGVLGEALSRVRSAVRVRPAEGESPDGQEPEAVIARMKTMLRGGNLAGAVREGQGLSDPAAAYFRPWLADAEIKASGLEALRRAEAKLAAAAVEAERNARRGG